MYTKYSVQIWANLVHRKSCEIEKTFYLVTLLVNLSSFLPRDFLNAISQRWIDSAKSTIHCRKDETLSFPKPCGILSSDNSKYGKLINKVSSLFTSKFQVITLHSNLSKNHILLVWWFLFKNSLLKHSLRTSRYIKLPILKLEGLDSGFSTIDFLINVLIIKL